MIQTIYVTSPPGYQHSAAFYEIALSFAYSLKTLGFPAEVTIDPMRIAGKTLVFGAHLIPKFGGSINGDYIIFNSEQLYDESPWMEGYLDILSKNTVWDYSLNNIEYLKSKGIEAKYCPIGYHPCMSNIISGRAATIVGESGIDYKLPGVGLPVGIFDVLFYGSINKHRADIIEKLRSEGKNVVVLNGYGAYRDKYIERAKIVLNLHYYDTAIFEIFRVSHLLANKKCVVSEYGREPSLEEPFRHGVAFCKPEDVVETCLDLLQDEHLRNDIANAGYDALRGISQAEILKGLL